MRRVSRFLIVALTLVAMKATGFTATSYVVTNNGHPGDNSVSLYRLNTTTGALTLIKLIPTGGSGLNGGDYGQTGLAISTNAHCLFAADYGSDDIAAFESPSYREVGRFSNSALNFSDDNNGGSIMLTSSGKFLYGSYTGSFNIGAWQVHPDCSLSFIAAYYPSVGIDLWSTLGVSPDGRVVVVPAPDYAAAETFIINENGTLTDTGYVSWASLPNCISPGCSPYGVDFTKDSQVAIFADPSSVSSVLTASLTPTGELTNPQQWSLPNSLNLLASYTPLLSAAGYQGAGFLYVGMFGGEITASFDENPLTVTPLNATAIDQAESTFAVTGNILVIVQNLFQIGVFRINSDGSLTLLSTTSDSNGVRSIALYPDTR